jgi:hypothetical protein
MRNISRTGTRINVLDFDRVPRSTEYRTSLARRYANEVEVSPTSKIDAVVINTTHTKFSR